MTSLTFANFFTFIYGWIGIWCTLSCLLMISRRGKEWEDYDVISFWSPVALVTTSVFLNRMFNPHFITPTPVVTPYLFFMLVSHSVLAYASSAITIRLIIRIWRERVRGETPVQGVERRHREMIDAFPDVGMGRQDVQDMIDDARS